MDHRPSVRSAAIAAAVAADDSIAVDAADNIDSCEVMMIVVVAVVVVVPSNRMAEAVEVAVVVVDRMWDDRSETIACHS